MVPSQRSKLLRYARRNSVVSRADLSRLGIHPETANRLTREGALSRIAPGQYRLLGGNITEHHGLALAAAAVPKGVVCLISALRFHDVGTQRAHHVWIALDRKQRKPVVEYPPLQIVRFSGDALTAGIEEHSIEGQQVRVYTLAKTIADCFKYRNKIGLDVALEALIDGWRSRRVLMSDLDSYARICRVHNVMMPYLETLVA
ncbi:MAG TPA: type IV toxin-antitoxin system AbiEi family antitoxin domain-containing protein [Thermoanaerobaculia bacterium]|nr:type IV toxin-antitoxin system AbiEi family antitoxin domain-containing protein [Thermoanaerobaculia bacterium]